MQAVELIKKTEMSKANLSQHMAIPVKNGIVISKKEGRKIPYCLSDPKIRQACSIMQDVMINTIRKKAVWWKKYNQEEKIMMTSDALKALKVDKVIDARGSSCPGPLLEAKKGIGAVSVGQIIEIVSNDAGTKKDIPAWAAKVGHEALGIIEESTNDRVFVKRLK
jgi:tRNA 2-thiouridine synthesizing protein A